MIVVDTNVLTYLYLPSEFSTAAEALLESDADWAAPFRDAMTSGTFWPAS